MFQLLHISARLQRPSLASYCLRIKLAGNQVCLSQSHNILQTILPCSFSTNTKLTAGLVRRSSGSGDRQLLRYGPCLAHVERVQPHALVRSKQTTSHEWEQKEFTELYFTKDISFLRILCRSTKLSILLFLLGAPASFLSVQIGMISQPVGLNITSVLASYVLLFTSQGFFFTSRVIAKVMMSKDEEIVKFSHLSLFGQRKDVFCRPGDIIPVKRNKGGGYLSKNLWHVRIRGYPKTLFYLPNQGHLDTDHELMELLLTGKLSNTR